MLEKVKVELRIKGSAFNDEIQSLIDAAKLDLSISGVANTTEADKLVHRAIVLYCKAHFGVDNPNSEKYLESYTSLKTHMSLASGYRVEVTP